MVIGVLSQFLVIHEARLTETGLLHHPNLRLAIPYVFNTKPVLYEHTVDGCEILHQGPKVVYHGLSQYNPYIFTVLILTNCNQLRLDFAIHREKATDPRIFGQASKPGSTRL